MTIAWKKNMCEGEKEKGNGEYQIFRQWIQANVSKKNKHLKKGKERKGQKEGYRERMR